MDDEHCTVLGHRIMARNVLKVLRLLKTLRREALSAPASSSE